MRELPAYLVFDGFWIVAVRKAHGFDRIRGGAECMSAHMAYGDGLNGGSCSRSGSRSFHLTDRHTACKTATNFISGVQLSFGESPRPGNMGPRTSVSRVLSFKQTEDSACAIRSPGGDQTPVGFAKGLG